MEDLASNWCLIRQEVLKSLHLMDANRARGLILVPIALGKYLFPFRTQKSSPVAPIILLQRETRKVPNYQKTTREGGFLICVVEMLGKKKPQP